MMFLLWVRVLFSLNFVRNLAYTNNLSSLSYSCTLYLFLSVPFTLALWNVLICEIKLQFLKPGDSNLSLAQGRPLSARLSLTGLRQNHPNVQDIVYEEFYRDSVTPLFCCLPWFFEVWGVYNSGMQCLRRSLNSFRQHCVLETELII